MSVSAGGPDDITLAAIGGSNLAERLEQLINSRKASEDAYASLQIGTDARAEYDKARDLRLQADKIIADAKAAANELIQHAQEQANGVIESANQDAARMRNEASQMRSDAAALRQNIDAQLAAAKATAQKQSDDAVKVATETQAKWAELAAQQIALGAQMQAAIDAEARWTAAVASLKSLIEKA